jgi:hypothetical protein
VGSAAASALSRFRKLKHLGIVWSDGLVDVLRIAGAKLVSLNIFLIENTDVWQVVAENCPDLKYLRLSGRKLKNLVELGSLRNTIG